MAAVSQVGAIGKHFSTKENVGFYKSDLSKGDVSALAKQLKAERARVRTLEALLKRSQQSQSTQPIQPIAVAPPAPPVVVDAQVSKDLEAAQRELQKTRQELEETQFALADANANIDTLSEVNMDFEGQVISLTKCVKKLEIENEDCEAYIEDLERSCLDAQQEVGDLMQEIADMENAAYNNKTTTTINTIDAPITQTSAGEGLLLENDDDDTSIIDFNFFKTFDTPSFVSTPLGNGELIQRRLDGIVEVKLPFGTGYFQSSAVFSPSSSLSSSRITKTSSAIDTAPLRASATTASSISPSTEVQLLSAKLAKRDAQIEELQTEAAEASRLLEVLIESYQTATDCNIDAADTIDDLHSLLGEATAELRTQKAINEAADNTCDCAPRTQAMREKLADAHAKINSLTTDVREYKIEARQATCLLGQALQEARTATAAHIEASNTIFELDGEVATLSTDLARAVVTTESQRDSIRQLRASRVEAVQQLQLQHKSLTCTLKSDLYAAQRRSADAAAFASSVKAAAANIEQERLVHRQTVAKLRTALHAAQRRASDAATFASSVKSDAAAIEQERLQHRQLVAKLRTELQVSQRRASDASAFASSVKATAANIDQERKEHQQVVAGLRIELQATQRRCADATAFASDSKSTNQRLRAILAGDKSTVPQSRPSTVNRVAASLEGCSEDWMPTRSVPITVKPTPSWRKKPTMIRPRVMSIPKPITVLPPFESVPSLLDGCTEFDPTASEPTKQEKEEEPEAPSTPTREYLFGCTAEDTPDIVAPNTKERELREELDLVKKQLGHVRTVKASGSGGMGFLNDPAKEKQIAVLNSEMSRVRGELTRTMNVVRSEKAKNKKLEAALAKYESDELRAGGNYLSPNTTRVDESVLQRSGEPPSPAAGTRTAPPSTTPDGMRFASRGHDVSPFRAPRRSSSTPSASSSLTSIPRRATPVKDMPGSLSHRPRRPQIKSRKGALVHLTFSQRSENPTPKWH